MVKSEWLVRAALVCFISICVACGQMRLIGQTNQSDTAIWLANAELAGPFVAPSSRRQWEEERKKVRAQLWQLLGKLPPRPKRPIIESVSHEDRGDYLLEKFRFDNG